MADDEQGWTQLKDRAPDDPREVRGTGVSRWSLLVLGLGIVFAVILGQNTERVQVDVLWASFAAPLFLVVLLAALGLTVLWEIGTLAMRHRRRMDRRR